MCVPCAERASGDSLNGSWLVKAESWQRMCEAWACEGATEQVMQQFVIVTTMHLLEQGSLCTPAAKSFAAPGCHVPSARHTCSLDPRPDISEEELEEATSAMGYGAVKYADLKNNRLTNYRFSYNEMLSMQVGRVGWRGMIHAGSEGRVEGMEEGTAWCNGSTCAARSGQGGGSGIWAHAGRLPALDLISVSMA